MSTNKDMASQLAALRKQAVNDDPHKSTAKTTRKKKPKKTKTKTETSPLNDQAERERTAVNLTPSAIDALKKIQAFLITECGAKSSSASAAVCIALEMVGHELSDRKEAVRKHYEALKKKDRRRKTA